MYKRTAALCAALVACAIVPTLVSAHPHELGEVYVPWTDKLTEQKWLMAGPSTAAAPAGAAAGTGAGGMSLVGNADKDGTTNSDLAFWGNLAYAGNYGGFRILDVSSDQPRTVVDQACNGPQNDVSVHEMGGKRSCSSRSTRRRPPRTARVRMRRSSTVDASATRACASSTSPIRPTRSSST
jgi:hypothetical protein